MTDVDATLVVETTPGVTRALNVDDFKTTATGAATQTTLAAVLAKLSADPATQTTLAALLVQAQAINASTDTLEALLSGTLAVSGPLTDTQLRAAAVAISAASLPLPAGAAQEHATAASPHSARLTDGTTYLGTTSQRLHVSDGGVALGSDLQKVAGTTVDTNSGSKSAGTQRVVLATDQPALSNALLVASSAETSTVYNGSTALTPKYAFANVAASQTDSSIVSAVTSKKIRVLAAFAVAGGTATDLTFNTKGAGAGTAKSAKLANGANGGAVLPFNAAGWFETASGEALTVTTGAGSTTGIQVVYVEV